MISLKTEEKAYIAGIIDGEGTITLAKKHKNEMPSPEVSIANNNLELLNWIKAKVGCGRIIKRFLQKPHHNISYVYGVSDDKALKLLIEINDKSMPLIIR